MSREGWKTWTKQDGSIGVEMADGRVVTVRNDGVTGYDFALRYLEKMRLHYNNHLVAMDLLLKESLGDRYEHVKRIPNVYNAHLAVASMSCVLGSLDNVPDCDAQGELHLKFVSCCARCRCRYNGYAEGNKGKMIVGCNPVYETGLTPSQARVADMLVNTSYSNGDIARALGVSENNIEYHCKKIYATLDVANRIELILLLKDKRIA